MVFTLYTVNQNVQHNEVDWVSWTQFSKTVLLTQIVWVWVTFL